MTQVQSIEKLLQSVRIRVESLHEAERRIADRLAPDFKLFDFFRGDENGISQCLACLLDPKGTHGQGGKFLASFIKYLAPHGATAPDWLNASPLQVQTERVTDRIESSNRRIDITIDWQDGVLGIENKPWATDQDQQLADYARQLQKSALARKCETHWLLIYLSDRDPDERSIPEDEKKRYVASGNYIELNYAMLCAWLDECAKESKALVVRIFIEEFAKYIRSSVMGQLDNSVENEVVELILTDGNLENAFLISKSLRAAQDRLLKRFFSDLETELERQVEHKFSLQLNRDYFYARKSVCSFEVLDGIYEQRKALSFCFEKSEFQKFFWGIVRLEETVCRDETWPQIAEAMNLCNWRQGKTTDWWPWWVWPIQEEFDGIDIGDWVNSPEPWQAMADGRLAKAIVKLAHKVYGEVFKDKEQLLC